VKVDAFGTPTLTLTIGLEGIPQPFPAGPSTDIFGGFGGIGSPVLTTTITIGDVPSAEAFGEPTLILDSDIHLESLPKTEKFGEPSISVAHQDLAADLLPSIVHVDDTQHGVLACPLPGQLTGRVGVPPPGLDLTSIAPSVGPVTWESGGRAPPGGGFAITLPGELIDLTPGANWFDRVHILPREPIDFERFVTPITREYEVFNAYHHRTVYLTEVTDTTEEGITLTNLPALPARLPPFSSFLDPSSVPFAPVRLKLTAEAAGVPDF
jgi:hypothetical protein